MTGAVLADPDPEPPHTRVRIELGRLGRSGAERRAGDRRSAPLRHRRAAARRGGAGGVLRRAPGPGAAGRALHRRAPARAGARADGPIKALLLDQRRIAGIGNIYADEALFRARYPSAAARRRAVARAVRAPARDDRSRRSKAGIDARGATIDDFRHVDGVRGSFQNRSSCTGAPGSRARVRDDDREDGRRGAGHLRVRDLPAAAASARARERRESRCRAGHASSEGIGSGAAARPGARSAAAWTSVKPPSSSPSISTCGKVIIPVCSTSSTRPAGPSRG